MTIVPVSTPLFQENPLPEASHHQSSSDLGSRIYTYVTSCFNHHRRNSEPIEELEKSPLLKNRIRAIAEQVSPDADSLNNSEQILRLLSGLYTEFTVNKNAAPLGFDPSLVINAKKSLDTDSSTIGLEKDAAKDFIEEFEKITSTIVDCSNGKTFFDKRNLRVKLFKFARVHDRFKSCLETRLSHEEGKTALAMANSHNPEIAEKGLEILKSKHPLIYNNILRPAYIYKQSQIHNMILGVRDHLEFLKASPEKHDKFREALINNDSEVFFMVPALGILKTINSSLKLKGIFLRHNCSWNNDSELSDKLKGRFQELVEAKEELQKLLEQGSVDTNNIPLALTDKLFIKSNPKFATFRNKLYSTAVTMSQEFSQDFGKILQEINS